MEESLRIAELIGFQDENNNLAGEFEFHSDWNDLMIAVEFIEGVKDGETTYKVCIERNRCFIKASDREEPIYDYTEGTKIDATYKVVLQFAKDYLRIINNSREVF